MIFNTQHYGRDFPKGSDLGEWLIPFKQQIRIGATFQTLFYVYFHEKYH